MAGEGGKGKVLAMRELGRASERESGIEGGQVGMDGVNEGWVNVYIMYVRVNCFQMSCQNKISVILEYKYCNTILIDKYAKHGKR